MGRTEREAGRVSALSRYRIWLIRGRNGSRLVYAALILVALGVILLMEEDGDARLA